MADKVLIDGLIKFCDEKSKNIKLKAEPQVFIEIKQALEELKNLKPSKKGFITIGQTIEDFEKEIRAKAINEFAERLKSDEFQKYDLDMVFETSRDLSYSNCVNAFCEYVDKITEELKAIKSDGFTDDLLNMGYTKGYRKAIDEFAEKLKETLNTYIEDAKDEGDYTYIKPFEISKRAVKEVAEQLKDGGENE